MLPKFISQVQMMCPILGGDIKICSDDRRPWQNASDLEVEDKVLYDKLFSTHA